MSATGEWFVYLLRCADGSLYCGMTGDLDARIAAHNAGRGGRFTRAKCRRPVELIVACKCPSKSFALKLELAVKKRRRDEKGPFLRGVAAMGLRE